MNNGLSFQSWPVSHSASSWGGASFAVKDRCYKRFTLCAKVDQILMHYIFGTFWATFALEKSSPWQTFRR